MAKTTEKKEVSIPSIDLKRVELRIVGDSPLLVHKFSEKQKKMMLEKQTKVAKTKGHDVRVPMQDFIQSMYWLEGEPTEYTEEAFNKAIEKGARFGFPSAGFKASAVSAGYRAGVTKDKVSMFGAFHIQGEFVEIQGVPEMREDMVTIGMGTADLRYRGEFKKWSANLNITYNAGVLSLEQLVNLFNLGGFSVGVGEWRVEKGGQNGTYHVE